ncbi:MAG: hypothetical protein QOE70_5906 [Chthoniobacter sp.]|jgi:hypothetical protein|nr:hypothetical protein [Chthoniobacter sp.]
MTRRVKIILPIAGAIVLGIGVLASARRAPTFNRDVAPILFANCVTCHRPGGLGPFNLLTFADAKKRARQIVEVTASRFMPPWLPARGCVEYLDERRLSEVQIETLRRWVDKGMCEGNPKDLPAAPRWSDDWELGQPDFIATMPELFTLPDEGRDVYRNFVVPLPITRRHFVRAIEVQPGNLHVVHHVGVRFDNTGVCRRLDAKDPVPGFAGMSPGNAVSPYGHSLSWQPGRRATSEADGTQWALDPGTDLVLQLHMRPSGKPEPVQARVAFYFIDAPPSRASFVIGLRSTAIDIPPGAEAYTIEDSYKIPVDVEAVSVYPHAHFLCQKMEGWAELPDGSKACLLRIDQWDFNWQSDYRFAHPIALPAGTKVRMRYTYDNSLHNPINEGKTLRRVQYGAQTSDEMGEFWLTLLLKNAGDISKLDTDYARNWALPDTISQARTMLARNPGDTESRVNLASALAISGRIDEALTELERTIAIDPRCEEAHQMRAQIFNQLKQIDRAKSAFATVLEINPDNYVALNDLGGLLLAEGQTQRAAEYFERALRANPNDRQAWENLKKARILLERQGLPPEPGK